MNNLKAFVILALLSLSFSLFGQATCGMHGEDLILQNQRAKLLQEYKKEHPSDFRKSAGLTYLPIKFHLVADRDGNGRILEHHVLEQLCYLNRVYTDYDIQFYIKDNSFSYIDNDGIYNSPNSNGSEQRMSSLRDRDAINMFITRLADTPGGVGTTLGYYSPGRDWLVLRSDQFTEGYTSTIGHEMGHFLSLLHPHNGWDDDPYVEATHGNPCLLLTKGNVPVELVDRSNCATAGDFLCDTPPDYLFGFGWSNCNYTGGTMDSNGDLIDPMETNFMGYFLHCDDFSYEMTEEQVDQMHLDIGTSERDYLQNSFVPLSEINGATYTLNPPHNTILNINESVEFDWSDASGCNNYLLQISNGNSFFDANIIYSDFHDVSWAIIDQLPEGANLYWRVVPMNEYATCFEFGGPSSYDRFETGLGTDVEELVGTSKVEILSNMISRGDVARLNLSSTQKESFEILVSDTQGKILSQENIDNSTQNTTVNIDGVSQLNTGLYFISVKVNNQMARFKIYIL